MMLCNQTSRYDVAIAAIAGGARTNPRVAVDAHTLISYLKHRARLDKKYIYENGKGERSDIADLHVANVM
jgi:xylulose-5-phosphate/fructose-6-phosphate phosphoketolase